MKLRALTTMLIMVLCSIALAGDGDEPKSETIAQTEAAPAPTPQTATGAAGMVYTTEEARGTSGALPNELRDALNQTLNTSSEGLSEQVLSDGTVTVDLKGRFQTALVVTIDDKGQLNSSCLSTAPGHTCNQHQATDATADNKPKQD